MVRGFRASCGKGVHGKEAAAEGELRRCFACDRPGSRDGCSTRWQHVGDSETWALLGEWSASVGSGWRHDRDLQQNPLRVGECICSRTDCVIGLYKTYVWRRQRDEKGPLHKMVVGQRSQMGRYPSTGSQVRALLEHVELEGRVLDCCGAAQDAVYTVLSSLGLRVATNDMNPTLVADTHLDAATDAFVKAYVEERVRPDWVVTSPPYKYAFAILKQAMRVGRMGVAFKLRLTFLEPTKTRGRWLKENAPDRVVMLPRATYRGRGCSSTEAWFIWETGRGGEEGRKPVICFSLPDGAL